MDARILKKGLIMGVVNITPDSFSDGGQFFKVPDALQQIERLLAEGADIIDLGAESSRPGAQPLSLEEEWQRLEPVLTEASRLWPSSLFSLDTCKAEIMRRALHFPVTLINDIRGGADFETLQVLSSRGLVYLAMHMHRDPMSMQRDPLDAPLALESVAKFYEETQVVLQRAGFAKEQIWLDPGIGFGKTDRANLLLIKQSMEWATRLPLVLGVSRKSFIGRLLHIDEAKDRDAPSKMLELSLILAGVKAIRTHDVLHLKTLRDLVAIPG